MRLSDLDDIARRQGGIIHRRQTGWSADAWRRAIRAGSLIGMHPGVARVVGSGLTERSRIRAGVMAVPGSVASHRSAAVMWGLVPDGDDTMVHVTSIDTDARRSALVGVTCHRPDDRRDVRAVHRDGIPITPPLRSLLDLGITDPSAVHGAVGAALSAGLLTLDGLEAGLARHARQGRTGVTALRSAIDDWALDARPADSVLEVAFARLVQRFGLPPVTFHERIERWEVDFRFVGTPIVVECDLDDARSSARSVRTRPPQGR